MTAECWSGGIELVDVVVVDAEGVGGTIAVCEVDVDTVDCDCDDDNGVTAAAATFAYPDGGFRGVADPLTILATDCWAKFACGGGLSATRNHEICFCVFMKSKRHTFCCY